jgi:cob(I)alamin adenosyltransferase
MGNRLSKIYTRTGDDGTTGLANGTRTDKDSPRIEAIGCIDELNSIIGMLISETIPVSASHLLTTIQHDLFDLGGELAIPEMEMMTAKHTADLEKYLDNMNESLPYLKEFILPAGSKATATCHLARAVCRRCERRTISLNREEPLNPHAITYINRLSDLLFVLARTLARHAGGTEIFWNRDNLKKED